MEVSQVKERVRELSEEIAEKVRQFETDTGTKLTYISLIRSETLGSRHGELADVELQIEL
jgi:hypothetical protein